jgi:hypothetical protein
MTTVNVRIERLDSGDRLYLPNGCRAPADRKQCRKGGARTNRPDDVRLASRRSS